MIDLSWDAWRALGSLALAAIPVIVKFRTELSKVIDFLAEGIGLIVLVAGVLLYTHSFPQWQQLQRELPQLSNESPVFAAGLFQTQFILYSGSIALMVLGGLLAFSGLVGRMRRTPRRSPFSSRRSRPSSF